MDNHIVGKGEKAGLQEMVVNAGRRVLAICWAIIEYLCREMRLTLVRGHFGCLAIQKLQGHVYQILGRGVLQVMLGQLNAGVVL